MLGTDNAVFCTVFFFFFSIRSYRVSNAYTENTNADERRSFVPCDVKDFKKILHSSNSPFSFLISCRYPASPRQINQIPGKANLKFSRERQVSASFHPNETKGVCSSPEELQGRLRLDPGVGPNEIGGVQASDLFARSRRGLLRWFSRGR